MMDLPELAPLLLPWFEAHRRDLPWRKDREPYHVWLSEIMLQQTRVEAVREYYLRFLQALPDIPALAACEDEKLYKLWQGLGYYSRVRNLKKAAQIICRDYHGEFPTDYASVRALPGIGDYTAGAICSICFGQPEPAVDGNVLRILTRISACYADISLLQTKKKAAALLKPQYPPDACSEFTQSLMELGAVVCLPNGAPLCAECPAAGVCRSRQQELWRELPVKAPKKARRIEEKTVWILTCGRRIAIRKRPDTGLLAGLWELPNLPGILDVGAAIAQVRAWGCGHCEPLMERPETHIFTHIEWRMQGMYLQCQEMSPEFVWVDPEELSAGYSMPTAFRRFLEAEYPRYNKETETAIQEARDIASGKIAAKTYASLSDFIEEMDNEC